MTQVLRAAISLMNIHRKSLRRAFRIWMITPLLVAGATAAHAQQYLGAITGTVMDPSGAVVKQAQITAMNQGTRNKFNTDTNSSGQYSLSALPIGHYSVTVSASGFSQEVQYLNLHGGDRLQADFHLHVGKASQSVTVSATAPLLETTTGGSGLTISPTQVRDLPLIGRNPFTLATLAPGVFILPGQVPGNSLRPFDNGGFDALEINGGRSETTAASIDGLSDNATDSGSASSPANIIFVPSPDMTQEFRVQTTMYDAQYGRSGGGSIAINLKHGTNKFHGVLSDYVRNDALNANDYADDRAGNKKPPFHWNEPGLEIDGPVIIPHLYNGTDKTFFMFGWDEIRTSTPAPVYETVPSALEREGKFSQSLNGQPLAIYDPLTTTQEPNGSYQRQQFANDEVPTSRIDPVAKAILPLIPQPNLPGNVDNLFVGPNNVVDAYDAFAYRVDQTINPMQRIFATYLYSDRHQTQGLDGFPAAISPSYLHYRTNYGAELGWTWIMSPSLISSFGVGWNEHRFAIYNHQSNFDLSSLNFPSYVSSSPAPNLFPLITIQDYSQFGNAGLGTGIYNIADNYDLRETLIKTVGRHDISFGGEVSSMRDDKNSEAGNSTFTFGRDFTQANPLASDASSGSAFASFLLGYADGGAASSSPRFAYRDMYYALFAQDDWRVMNKLTLTLGLRWDTESPQEDGHQIENTGFDPNATYSFAGQSLHGEVQFPTHGHTTPYNWDLNNFGPRLGFAYSATKKLVVRGGFGMLYSPTFDVPSAVGFSVSTPFVASLNNLLTPYDVLSNPYPDGYLQPEGASTNLNGQGGWTYWQNHTRQIPRTMQASLGFEYQLPYRSVLDIRYVNQESYNLPNSRNPNFLSTANLALGNKLNDQVTNPFAGQLPGTPLNGPTISLEQSLLPYPQYETFTEIVNNGTTSYNGLQVRLEKRITHGFHMLVSYTYSKSMVTGYLNDQDTELRSWIDHYDLPQVLSISGGYRLPFFDHASNHMLKQSLGGWSVNAIISASSGELYAAPTGVQSTGLDPHISNPTISHEFNTCTQTVAGTLEHCEGNEQPAWYVTPPFTLNNLTPYFGGFRSPVVPDANLSIFKTFPVYKRANLQFRAESFNLTNTPQFGGPDTNVTDSTFGARTNFAQNNDPRNIQVALRLQF